jgi:hypothetical protein
MHCKEAQYKLDVRMKPPYVFSTYLMTSTLNKQIMIFCLQCKHGSDHPISWIGQHMKGHQDDPFMPFGLLGSP